MKLRFKIGIGVLIAFVGLSASAIPTILNASTKNDNNPIFSLSNKMKYKKVYSSAESSKKGMLLYSYDSGSSATYKKTCSGIFTTELVNINGSLGRYSFEFNDLSTNQTFSIGVNSANNACSVYVEYGGEKAGQYYYQLSQSSPEKLYGVTSLHNQNNQYTTINSYGTTLMFDPSLMIVKALGTDGGYRTVWDFTNTYNDGKRLYNDLDSFTNYSVTIHFDNVPTNEKGQLLIYSFAGTDLNKEDYSKDISIKANVTLNAYVNEQYSIPEAKIESFGKETSTANLTVSVFDRKGNKLNQGYLFTPTSEGSYYILYEYNDGEIKAHQYYKIDALIKKEEHATFVYEEAIEDNNSFGINHSMYIPKAYVTSERIINNVNFSTTVTIKKDDVEITKYSKIPGGFTYKFEDEGIYDIIYECPSYLDAKETKHVVISQGIISIIEDDYSKEPCKDEVFRLPKAKVYYLGEIYNASSVLIFPSGKIVEYGSATLTEIGFYQLLFTSDINQFSRTLCVRQLSESLFDGTTSFGFTKENNETYGVKVSLEDNKPITYGKILDLSNVNFDDSETSVKKYESNTPLIDFVASPKTIGVGDVDKLYIVLTDAHNPENSISIRYKYINNDDIARIRTKSSKQKAYAGYNYNFFTGEMSVHAALTHEDGGFTGPLSWTMNDTGSAYEDRASKLYWDNERASLYARPAHLYASNDPAKGVIPWLVREYQAPADEEKSAGDNPWQGWTTGEVYLSLYATGVTTTADFYIKSINGQDLTKEFIYDNEGPEIKISIPEDGIPKAVANKSFNILPFEASDSDSNITKTSVSVYYENKTSTPICVDESSFTPKEVGTYIIAYSATDAFGNTSTKDISVNAVSEVDDLELSADYVIPSSVNLGTTIKLPNVTAKGGAGNTKIETKVITGQAEEIAVTNNSFVVETKTTYTVTWKATDYIGNTDSLTQTISNVASGDSPVFDENSIQLPEKFISDDTYCFYPYVAIFYNAQAEKSLVNVKITVTDANGERVLGENLEYTPKANESVDTASIKFEFIKEGATTTTILRKVPIITINNETGFLVNYFNETNATKEASSEGITFKTKNEFEDSSISFLRPLGAASFSTKFNVNDVDEFTVFLKDKYDPIQEISIHMQKHGKKWYASVNGEKETVFNLASGNFIINYNNSTRTITDGADVTIAVVDKLKNASDFFGFSSSSLYYSISYKALSINSSICIVSIDNQTMNLLRKDSVPPMISVLNPCSGRYTLGSKINISKALAFDVLNTVIDVSFTVQQDGKTIINSQSAKEDYSFTPSEYGKYVVTYKAKDKNNNQATYTCSFTVVDDIKPSLVFASANPFPEEVNVNDKVSLPAYTIVDNGDVKKASVKIYVYTPDGQYQAITGDSITFKVKGINVIYYMVTDENGNRNVYSFNVKVK